MDDPLWAWPAWKFDMRREDLFTTLHDRYNTYQSPIQDPNAFYHDIFEISQVANSPAEFHHLANNRKEQRLRELNNTLESASFEIIANPCLVGMPQWQHAIQLFRANSLDSLVAYFASYLPTDRLLYHACTLVTSSTGTMPCLSDEECARTETNPTSSIRPYHGARAGTKRKRL